MRTLTSLLSTDAWRLSSSKPRRISSKRGDSTPGNNDPRLSSMSDERRLPPRVDPGAASCPLTLGELHFRGVSAKKVVGRRSMPEILNGLRYFYRHQSTKLRIYAMQSFEKMHHPSLFGTTAYAVNTKSSVISASSRVNHFQLPASIEIAKCCTFVKYVAKTAGTR